MSSDCWPGRQHGVAAAAGPARDGRGGGGGYTAIMAARHGGRPL